MSERWKAFRLTPEQVVDLLSGRMYCLPRGIPESAKLVRYAHQWETNSAIIILSDESFPRVEEGVALVPDPVLTLVRK